ncbi:MAG: peptidase [Frankiales bacterium]|nr:peptidase [Frankiales bacterium]
MADPRFRSGVLIGRVAGVPILLMPSWFLFAAYLVISGQSLLSDQVGQGEAYWVAAAFVLMLLASVVLHEIGHCLVARAFDLPVRSISVTLLAGLTEITEPPQTPAREYAVAVSGPMVSLLLSGTGVAAANLFDHGSTVRLLFEGVAVTNGAIAALNLLPGLPLDGGRVLRSVLWQLGKDQERATRASARAGMAIALVVVPGLLIGVLPALGVGRRDASTIVLSALVGAFIYIGAVGALRRSKAVSKLPLVSVTALARPALPVTANLPLAEAVRQAHELGARGLLVVDGNGRLEGIVSEAWVRQVPVDRRPWVVVADGARRLEPGLMIDPDLAGEELLTAMRATPASEYVVTGPYPRVLVSSDVAAAMSV